MLSVRGLQEPPRGEQLGPIGIGALPHVNQARVLCPRRDGISHHLGGPSDTGDRLGPAGRASQRLLEVLARPAGLPMSINIDP
jgi:hypothetical protein